MPAARPCSDQGTGGRVAMKPWMAVPTGIDAFLGGLQTTNRSPRHLGRVPT